MTVDAEAAAAKTVRGPRAWWVLLSLVVGLIGGTLAAKSGDGLREPMIQVASIVGDLWLNALKMTVIPLIVALLVGVMFVSRGQAEDKRREAWQSPAERRVLSQKCERDRYQDDLPLAEDRLRPQPR